MVWRVVQRTMTGIVPGWGISAPRPDGDAGIVLLGGNLFKELLTEVDKFTKDVEKDPAPTSWLLKD